MSLVVFLGPTLRADEAAGVLKASYLPPVSQGDLYRAALDRPAAIGIVDGFFERVPAVWHKEILWAMSQGIHVFGAASMGALRAAELAAFGMVGVGKVFEAFHGGELEDDDEVTVAHAPAQGKFGPLSEAMVNIRATLARAHADGVIATDTRQGLQALAKSLHYPLRNLDRVIRLGREQNLPDAELSALTDWLPTGRVDQKRLDALAMLEAMKHLAETDPGPKRVYFHFEHTDAWEQVARRSGRQMAAARPDALPTEILLDELRLREGAFGTAMDQSLARALALEAAARHGGDTDKALFRETFNRFFVERGLRESEQIRDWIADQGLDREGLAALLQREAKLQQVRKLHAPQAMERLEDHLRATGIYGELAGRAQRKRVYLAEQGLDNPSLAVSGMTEEALLDWFFVERRRGSVPDDLDIYAQTQGFANRLSMLQSLLREYYFVTGCEGRGTA
jgi:hypothetical protein